MSGEARQVDGVEDLLALAAGSGECMVGWNVDPWEGLEVAAVYGVGDGPPTRLGWAVHLGAALAGWAGVRFEDLI